MNEIIKLANEGQYRFALSRIYDEINDLIDEHQACFESDDDTLDRIMDYPIIGYRIRSLQRWMRYVCKKLIGTF